MVSNFNSNKIIILVQTVLFTVLFIGFNWEFLNSLGNLPVPLPFGIVLHLLCVAFFSHSILKTVFLIFFFQYLVFIYMELINSLIDYIHSYVMWLYVTSVMLTSFLCIFLNVFFYILFL